MRAQGSSLDLNIKAHVHYSRAYTGARPHWDTDVTKRLKAVSAASGALKGVFRNRHLDYKVKKMIYRKISDAR